MWNKKDFLKNETKKMKKIIITIVLIASSTLQTWSYSWWEDTNINARLGYSIGGTAPLDMPATIRKLNSYSPRTNIQVGIDFYKPLNTHWGMMVGFQMENKGMKTDATVKNYHMEIKKGGNRLEGMFTGNVESKVTEWMFTIPVLATYELGSHFRLKFGPYGSLLTSKEFSGVAYDGYLRKTNPTGNKILLGHEEGQRGLYNFSDDMRQLQWGIKAGCDYYFSQHWGAYAEVNWGISGIFNRNFKTIEQTMYPIYGTFGLIYKLK